MHRTLLTIIGAPLLACALTLPFIAAPLLSVWKGHEAEFQAFLERFRIVTPTDLRRQDVKSRRDIVEKKLDEIRQEAPYAFKGIGPIVETLHGAQIAQPVAELTPLMTIKG